MPKVINLRDKERDRVYERIDRITMWGNPFIIEIHGNRDTVVDAHLYWLNRWVEDREEIIITIGEKRFSNKWVMENIELLKGKDLACWCAPERCHGDNLLKLANI
jgi:Domain of unknown function (DUF4326)